MAILKNWLLHVASVINGEPNIILQGTVFDSPKFKDNTYIFSSKIEKVKTTESGFSFETFSGSIYDVKINEADYVLCLETIGCLKHLDTNIDVNKLKEFYENKINLTKEKIAGELENAIYVDISATNMHAMIYTKNEIVIENLTAIIQKCPDGEWYWHVVLEFLNSKKVICHNDSESKIVIIKDGKEIPCEANSEINI